MADISIKPYTFNSHQRLLEFVGSLITEGYSVGIQTIYQKFPCENSIDHYEVFVGEKKKPIKVYVENEDSENVDF